MAIVRPTDEIQQTERFQAVRAEALRLIETLRTTMPRSSEASAAVSHFQQSASVTGEGGATTGLYGPATRLALEYFSGVEAPPVWQGTRPGEWTPPAWTRDVVQEVSRFPYWLLALGGTFVVTGGIVIASGIQDSRGRRAGG